MDGIGNRKLCQNKAGYCQAIDSAEQQGGLIDGGKRDRKDGHLPQRNRTFGASSPSSSIDRQQQLQFDQIREYPWCCHDVRLGMQYFSVGELAKNRLDLAKHLLRDDVVAVPQVPQHFKASTTLCTFKGMGGLWSLDDGHRSACICG